MLLLFCNSYTFARKEYNASWLAMGYVADTLQGRQAGERRGQVPAKKPEHQVSPQFISCSRVGFWTFSKARWGKGVTPFNWRVALIWSVSCWNCLKENRQSRLTGETLGSFHLNLWLQIPLEPGGESVLLYFWVKRALIDLSSDYMLRWDTGMYSLICIQYHSNA